MKSLVMFFFALVVLLALQTSTAFRRQGVQSTSTTRLAPAFLFNFGAKKSSAASKKEEIKPASALTLEAVSLFRKSNTKSTVTDSLLEKNFVDLASVLSNSEANAIECVRAVPNVLLQPKNQVSGNFEVFVGKWGVEKATGVVQRNPLLLAIPTTGYGSAEVAGDDAVVLSYVIAYTRPIGGVLLGLLFAALLKPIVFGFN